MLSTSFCFLLRSSCIRRLTTRSWPPEASAASSRVHLSECTERMTALVSIAPEMGGYANARVRGFLHSTTRYMYLEHGCTRFCAGGGRWPGRRNEKGPKYVPNKETRYKMRAHAQRWYRTVVPAAPGRAWGTTWPGPTDTNAPGTIWGRPGAVTGHYEYNNNDNIQKPHA